MTKIYKISFSKFLSLNSPISDIDLELIGLLEIISTFDYDEGDMYNCYIISSEKEMEKYKKILNFNLVEYKCSDISDDILKNKYNIYHILDYVNEFNYYSYELFIADLNEWIYERLDMDLVLDMISLNGFNSLRKIDKKFLEEYNAKNEE